MYSSVKRLVVLSSSLFMLSILSMISGQVSAEPKPAHYKHNQVHPGLVHPGARYDK